MDDPAKSQIEEHNRAAQQEESGELKEVLTKIIKESETDENFEKLSKKMSDEWRKPAENNEQPDLSFSKFQEKLRKSQG